MTPEDHRLLLSIDTRLGALQLNLERMQTTQDAMQKRIDDHSRALVRAEARREAAAESRREQDPAASAVFIAPRAPIRTAAVITGSGLTGAGLVSVLRYLLDVLGS